MLGEIYTIEELSEGLQVTIPTIRQKVREGKLRGYRSLGRLYFTYSDVEAFITQGEEAPEAEQVQEQVQPEQTKATKRKRKQNASVPADSMIDEFIALYAEICPMLSQWRDITSERRKKVAKLLPKLGATEEEQRETAKTLLGNMATADEFYRSKKWFSLDWLIRPNEDNYLKVLEGLFRETQSNTTKINTRYTPQGGVSQFNSEY